MLTKDQIAMAEEKCLEVVNTRKHHDFYHPVFARILGQYGAERTWRCATDLLLYKGDQWDRLMSSGVSSELCDVRNFISASQYNGVSQTTEFSRYVVALVLEHWLSSNAPKSQNRSLKPGDAVRIMVPNSITGSQLYAVGTVLELERWDVQNGKPICVVGGNFYYPETLQLVTSNTASKATVCDAAISAKAAAHDNLIFNELIKETAMSLKIETKTFVNGAEIAKMNVEGLVTIIRQTEDEIRSLEALESKPKKVVNKIEELKAGLAKLVEHADAE